jgi:hypothetical protein
MAMTYGSLNLPEPSGLVQAFTGIALPLPEQKIHVLWAPKSLIQAKLTSFYQLQYYRYKTNISTIKLWYN